MITKSFKQILHRYITEHLRQKKQTLEHEIESLIEDQQSDSKNSAGDKYETGREMIQLEIDRLEGSVNIVKEQLAKIDRLKNYDARSVAEGSLVETQNAIYYLAIPLGKITVEGADIIVLSKDAPKAQAMLGKKAGDEFSFNAGIEQIQQIC
jgi:transcription elongation GreA/GreB family factor